MQTLRPLQSVKAALVALAVVSTAGAASAQDAPFNNPELTTGLRFGIVCYGDDATPVPAPDTITGFINERSEGGEIVTLTSVIPMIRGLSFGVRVELLDNIFLDGVTLTVIHPPQTDAGVTTESWTSNFEPNNTNGGAFTFEFPYEETPGAWTMEAHHNGELLYRVDFQVVEPALLDPMPRLCKGEALLG